MNVCVISREYPPFFGGGIGSYTEMFTWALARAGHAAVVLTVSDDGQVHREDREGVHVVRIPFIRHGDWSAPDPAIRSPEVDRLFAELHAVSVFAHQAAEIMPELVREFDLDVIEAPDTGALGWFLLDRARREPSGLVAGRTPLVTTIHSPTDWIAVWNRSRLAAPQQHALARMEGEQIAWSHGLVCPSRALASWCEAHWSLPGAIDVVPYPLGPLEDVARRRATPGAELEWSQSGPRSILYAGRLEPRKGVDTLLKGFAWAVAGGADVTLDLAGEDTPDPTGGERGFGEASLHHLVPRDVRARVRLLGKLAPERLATLRDAAPIHAVPSPMDNFPITCMESMASGRVVLAARAGGMAEMIEDGRSGVLFAPNDAAACGAAIIRASAMPADQARLMGARAAQRMLACCGNELVVPRRLAHYEEAIRRARGPVHA